MEGIGQENVEGDSASGAVKRVLRSRIIEVDNNSNSSTTSLGMSNSNGLDSVNSAADNRSITVTSSALKEVINQSTPVKRNTRSKITSASSGLSETCNSQKDKNVSPDDKRKATNSLDDIESQTSVSPHSQCGSEASGVSGVMVLRSNKVIPLQNSDKEVIENTGGTKSAEDLKSCEVILNDVTEKLKDVKCTEKDNENAKNSDKMIELNAENESEQIVTDDNVNEKSDDNNVDHESNESIKEVVNTNKTNEDDTEDNINNHSPSIINKETITELDKIAVLNKAQDEECVLVNELSVNNKIEKITKNGNDDITAKKTCGKVSTSDSDDNDNTKLELRLDVIASSPSSSENDEEIASVHITSNEPKVLKLGNSEQDNGVINKDEKSNGSDNNDDAKDKGDNFVDSDTTEEFVCVKRVSDRKPIPDVSSIDKSNDDAESNIEDTINIESKVINKSTTTNNSNNKSDVSMHDTLENLEGGTCQIEKKKDALARITGVDKVVSDTDSDDSDFFPFNLNKEISLIDKSKSSQKKIKKNKSDLNESSVFPVVNCVVASETKKQQYSAQKVITTEQEKIPAESEVEFQQKKIDEATDYKVVSAKSKSNLSENKVSDVENNENVFLKSHEERGSKSKISLTNVFNLLSVSENKDMDLTEEDDSSLNSVVNEAITNNTERIRKQVTIESSKPQYYGIGQDLLKDIVKEAVAEAVGSVKEELLNIKKEFHSVKNMLKKLERGKKRKFDESFPQDSDEDTSVTSVFDVNAPKTVESSDQNSLKSKDELVQMLLEDVSDRLQLPKKKKKRKSIKNISNEQGHYVKKKIKLDVTDADLINIRGNKNNVTNINKICKKKKINKLKLTEENDDINVTENRIINRASADGITKQYLNSVKSSDSDKFCSKKKRSSNSDDINYFSSVLINQNDNSGNTSLDKKTKKKKGKKRKFNLQLQDASVNTLVETSLGPIDGSAEKKNKKAGKLVSLESKRSIEQEVDSFSTNFDTDMNERRKKGKKKKNKLNLSKSDSNILNKNAAFSSLDVLKNDFTENRNEKGHSYLEANLNKANKNFVIDEVYCTGNSSQQLFKKKKKKKQKNGSINSSSPLVTAVSLEDYELPEEVSTRQFKFQSPNSDANLLFKKKKSRKSSTKNLLYRATPYK
ncbi:uncharacterized protein LOC142324751 isoform X2 [Lycorma delicatula]|uniref:uncharacterized protein LOC142324751 isoform X2 n=1 Tax=Lycorma delicatula TaxID=130591 RepID=UPI003F5155E0